MSLGPEKIAHEQWQLAIRGDTLRDVAQPGSGSPLNDTLVGQQVQQCAQQNSFAGPVRTDDRQVLATRDLEAEVSDDSSVTESDAKPLHGELLMLRSLSSWSSIH